MSRNRKRRNPAVNLPEENTAGQAEAAAEALAGKEDAVPAAENEAAAETPAEARQEEFKEEQKEEPEAPAATEGGEAVLPAARRTAGDIRMIVFGAIVLVFAVIGVIASVVTVGRGVASLIRQDSVREDYEWLVTPLVLQDPPQFESPEDATDSTVITAGVWRLIMNSDTSVYPADSMNFITVPATDIEVQIRALFGEVEYTHQTVGDSELLIMYDAENNSYIFPAVPHVLSYTPEVESIEKPDSETVVLTVGYIPPGPVWQGDTTGNSYRPGAEKEMEITLKKAEDGSMTIYALKSAGDTAGDGDLLAEPSGQDSGTSLSEPDPVSEESADGGEASPDTEGEDSSAETPEDSEAGSSEETSAEGE